MPSAVFDNVYLKTGDYVQRSGHYIYKGSPKKGVLPCIPTKEEKVIMLKKGDRVPSIASCNNHEAVYRLTISAE